MTRDARAASIASRFFPFFSFDCPPAPLNIANVDDLVLGTVVASNVGHDWRRGRRR